jgi:hypothetical protein
MILKLRTRKALVAGLATLALLLTAGLYAIAQQAMDESKRDRAVAVQGGKYHLLPATLETTQWGWLDPKESPKLVVNSGDTVAVETMMHAHNKIQPGTTMDEIVALRKANPGGGPHSLTGPIYVNGAEPGDVMEIRILKITPKAFGTNFNLPGKEFPTIGALAPEMPDGSSSSSPWTGSARPSSSPGSRSTCAPSRARWRLASTPTIRRLARAAPPTRWRRCRRYVPGRTARTWTSTSYRKARRSSFRCF